MSSSILASKNLVLKGGFCTNKSISLLITLLCEEGLLPYTLIGMFDRMRDKTVDYRVGQNSRF